MAMAQKPHPSSSSSSSSSSSDPSALSSSSSNQPRPPPYFTPVSRTPPPPRSLPSSKAGEGPSVSPITSSGKGVELGAESGSISSPEGASGGALTSSVGVASPPTALTTTAPPAAIPVPLVMSPLSCMLLPPGLGGGAAAAAAVATPRGMFVTPHYTIPLHAGPTPGPTPSGMLMGATPPLTGTPPFPLSILPTTAAPFSLLTTGPTPSPTPAAMPLLSTQTTTSHPLVAPPLLSPPTLATPPFPLRVSQTDLEVLTHIQNRINTHLNSMSSDDESAEPHPPPVASGGPRPPEQPGSEESQLPSPGSVQLCVAQPAEVLRRTLAYQESLQRQLSRAECHIERCENASIFAWEGVVSNSRTIVAPVVATAPGSASSSLSSYTAVKFTSTVPRPSPTSSYLQAVPTPIGSAHSSDTSPHTSIHLSPLKSAPPPSSSSLISSSAQSSPSPVAIGNLQYSSLLPLLYTPLATPLRAGVVPPPQAPLMTPGGYFVLPSTMPTATNGRGGLAPLPLPTTINLAANSGLLSLQQLATPAAGGMGVAMGTSTTPPLCLVVPQPSVLTAAAVTPPTLQLPSSSDAGAMPTFRTSLLGNTNVETQNFEKNDSRLIAPKSSASQAQDVSTRKRQRRSKLVTTSAHKLLKLADATATTSAVAAAPPRESSLAASHTQWSGKEETPLVSRPRPDEEHGRGNGDGDGGRRRRERKIIISRLSSSEDSESESRQQGESLINNGYLDGPPAGGNAFSSLEYSGTSE